MKKIILSCFIAVCMLSISTINTHANDSDSPTLVLVPLDTSGVYEDGTAPQPRWWPGDPNPQLGSQEWLWTHTSYTTPSSAKAKKCGLEALKGATITGGAQRAVEKWLLKLAFNVGSFAASFGIGFAYSYYTCLTK